MSIAEIIAELSRLSPQDRAAVQARLDELSGVQQTAKSPATLARIHSPRLAKPAQSRDFIKQATAADAAL